MKNHLLQCKMNEVRLTPTSDDLYALAAYAAGMYRKLTGIPCALIFDRVDLQPGQSIVIQAENIPEECDLQTKIILEPLKRELQDRVLIGQLQSFIVNQCLLERYGSISAQDLHAAFQGHIHSPISHTRLFPALMDEIMKVFPTITKTVVKRKVTYLGIKLKYEPPPIIPQIPMKPV